MKADLRLAESAKLDGEKLRNYHRFLNMVYDAYVHGSYETTMELYDPVTGGFMTSGNTPISKREEFVEALFLKLHEVVHALELTAAVTANESVFKEGFRNRHVPLHICSILRYKNAVSLEEHVEKAFHHFATCISLKFLSTESKDFVPG